MGWSLKKNPMNKKPMKASIDTRGGMAIGISDVIRWNDEMDVNGTTIKVSKAVELGLKYKLEIAEKLEHDLKSRVGLLITFPIAMLMDALQREVGTGAELLELVKP